MEIEIVNNWPEAKRHTFARIGKHAVGSDLLEYHTWAEFDISQFTGKTAEVKQIGLRIYNAWPGTKIGQLKYTTGQPSTLTKHQLFGQHNRPGDKNCYENFNMTLNPSGAWTPDSGGYFYPPGTWDAHRRVTHDNQTILEDLKSHIDDGKSWFGLEFSYSLYDRSNLYLTLDNKPVSVVMEVTLVPGLDEGKNAGTPDGDPRPCPDMDVPINFSTGNAYQVETDFQLSGPGLPMGYTRSLYRTKNGYLIGIQEVS
jgi:hypothetical protein